jgi:hypothetical protein
MNVLTPDEYLCPDRFPLTTHPGLSLDQQMLLDAVQYDEIQEKQESGVELACELIARRAELAQKMNYQIQLRRWG